MPERKEGNMITKKEKETLKNFGVRIEDTDEGTVVLVQHDPEAGSIDLGEYEARNLAEQIREDIKCLEDALAGMEDPETHAEDLRILCNDIKFRRKLAKALEEVRQ